MAQTHQPDDDEGAWTAGPVGEPPKAGEAGGDGATTALPPYGGGPRTPGRGTAAPLGTVGDGRYRLTHRLGRGGMAEVLAAQDIRLGRTVAVKLLRGELAQDEIARLRFTREAHAVAALNHHSIVSVYDTGEEYVGDESTPYIVMELVEGRTVRELLVDEEAPPVDQALIIIAGVLEALAYSHRHGIVHRDIKPANVIITTTGAVKVMDFGIARALTGTASTMTQTGMVMGTPQYLSPEQALGKPVDHRSDLYAAGCMLYELLTLRPPFTGDTPLSVVYQHVQDMPVPPSQANGRVPAALDHLVLRSLAKNPDDRFQDADEFRAHVQHALREMHGAGGAWAAGAAAAGLAAAGQGHSGATPVIGTDETAVLGSGASGDATTMMPFPPSTSSQTPSTPYPGAGGPYGGAADGPGGDGGDGNGSGRRRGPWGWVAGAVAVLVAAGAGIGFALSGDGGDGGTKHGPTPSATVSTATTTEAGTPTTGPSPTTAPTTQATRRPQQPTDNTFGGNQSQAPTVPSGKHTPTSSATATGTRSSSPSASATGTPTGGATGTPTGGATGTPTGGATATQPPPKPTSTSGGGGGGGASPTIPPLGG
ncbi:protein kinase [Kitasatospora sp. CM 4170]|uniref:non-specific serine/threonine protein kinase n=1 Tax=Kitasatospora aburaviensis TaxID=67265 RepID=A0ABW1EZ86_9ACTN|nr:protein kinase [Kitasatospora sp. CM 4170]WNM46795.1 protein kinase [Kitasatospora sp. CM 4170]